MRCLGRTFIVFLAILSISALESAASKRPVGIGGSLLNEGSLSDVNLTALESGPAPKDKGWGRDPFIPPPKATIDDGPLELTAVILGNGKGVAIINKRIYRIGDVVSGRVVERILRDRVILSDRNGTLELRVQALNEAPVGEHMGPIGREGRPGQKASSER